MTRPTALALIRRLDINATLRAAGREPSRIDLDEQQYLVERARGEDLEASRG